MSDTPANPEAGTTMPADTPGVVPYLIVPDAQAAIDWYARHLGAVERFRLPGPDGTSIMHAELEINGGVLMLGQAQPDRGHHAPDGGALPISLMQYVADVDAVVDGAANDGATVLDAPEAMFWGDRMAKIRDPFGFHWSLGTRVETVSPEEIRARAATLFGDS